MAFQPIFGQIPVQQGQSLLDMLTQRKMENEALASKGAERAFTEAKTKKITEGIEHPELNLAGLPEIARQRAYVESVKKAYGADSPQAMQAQKDLNLTVSNLQSQQRYRNVLAETLPKRSLSTLGKVLTEQQLIELGYSPTGKPIGSKATAPIKPQVAGTPLGTPYLENKLATMSKEDLIKAKNAPFGTEASALYSLYGSKLSGMGDNIKKLPYAALIEGSLATMLPYRSSMAYYSGVAGRAKYAKDIASSQLTGEMTPQLRDYTKYKEMASSTLAPQIRQYYGDSITPSVQKKLEDITNPSTWKNSPERALTSLDALIEILRKEIKIRKDLVEHPSFLTKKPTGVTLIADKVKKTGMSFTELAKIANEKNIPNVETLIDNIIKFKGST